MPEVGVNTKAMKKWAKDIENLANHELDSFLREAALMLAGQFLEKVIERTPEGKYPEKIEFTTRDGKNVSFKNPLSGMKGGHLQKSWKLGELKEIPGGYEIEIFNDATTDKGESYASHIEYGHRVMNQKGGEVKNFVPGRLMMTQTEIEMAFLAPELLEAKFEEFLRRVM